jgi:hypothetical protein
MTAVAPLPRSRPAPNTRPNLRVAPETRRRRRRARLLVFITCLVTVASLFTLVSFHVFAAQSAFELDKLAKQRTNEQLRYERLRDTVARQSSPDAVIAEAQRLGMVSASGQLFIDAPAAAPQRAASPGPATLSGTTYDTTKKALDDNP